MGKRERVAEDLLSFYREKFCQKCKMSFVCLMGKEFRETFWCTRCKGWWLSEHDMFVRCDGFPGTTVGHFERRRDGSLRPVSAHHDGKTTIDGCPLCEPQGENPQDIIEGFVVEET